jgi:hypothetical protein
MLSIAKTGSNIIHYSPLLMPDQKLATKFIQMRWFKIVNFCLAAVLLFFSFTQGGALSLILLLLLLSLFSVFAVPEVLLGIVDVETSGGCDYICGPSGSDMVVGLVLIALTAYFLNFLDKKRSVRTGSKRSNKFMLALAAIVVFYNLGSLVVNMPSWVEMFKNRPSSFEQEIGQKQVFPLFGFSMTTPEDWVEGIHSSDKYITLVPKKIKDNIKNSYKELTIHPSLSSGYSSMGMDVAMAISDIMRFQQGSGSMGLNGSDPSTKDLCGGNGVKYVNFAGSTALECTMADSYTYVKVIRITDLSNLNARLKSDNAIWFYLDGSDGGMGLAPLYEKVLSTFTFTP